MIETILMYILAVPAIIISLSFHELAHAYVSYKLGDPTAKHLGRLTMNPLKHLDPLGTLMLLIALKSGLGFGWAKPVPIDPSYYKNHKRGTVLVSLAGPVSNLLIALIFSFPMAYIAMKNGISSEGVFLDYQNIRITGYPFEIIVFYICMYFYMINIGLAVFNILPIPPLDGSKILTAILPANLYFKLMRYENYVGLAFLAIMLINPAILSIIMRPFRSAVQWVFMLIGTPLLNLVA
jgi:Zn-dependent protease